MSDTPEPKKKIMRGIFPQVVLISAATVCASVAVCSLILVHRQKATEFLMLKKQAAITADLITQVSLDQAQWDSVSSVSRFTGAAYSAGSNPPVYVAVAGSAKDGEEVTIQHENGWKVLTLDDTWREPPEATGSARELNSPFEFAKGKILDYSVPISIGPRKLAVLHVGVRMQQDEGLIPVWARTIILTMLIGSGVAVLLGLYLSRKITQPFKSLRSFASRLTQGDWNARAEAIGTMPEVEELTKAMNTMADGLGKNHRELESANECLHQQISARIEAEASLQKRMEAESFITKITRDFLNAPNEKLSETIQQTLQNLALQVQASAATVVSHRADASGAPRKWHWTNGEQPVTDADQFDAPATFVDSEPTALDATPETHSWMQQRGLVSLGHVALGSGAQPAGYLTVRSSCLKGWSSVDAQIINSVAATISNALERMRAHEEREEIHAQLLQAQKMEAVGKLSGGIAHDFNNMLVPIVGYTDTIINSAPADSAWLPEMREIKRAAESAASLTRQLLSFSRKQIMTKTGLHVNDLVGHVQKMLRRTIGENIHLETNTEKDLWTIHADACQIEQCLVNLTVNAGHALAGSGGTIRINTEMVDSEDASFRMPGGKIHGLFVRLRVSDNGCGMSPATLARIFEPFYSTKGTDGTGLGLSVVHGIVTDHGGWITVDSELGKGTTFSIYLPAYQEPSETAVEIPVNIAPVVKGTGQRILVIEDEPAVLAFVRAALKQNGYAVITADCAAKARTIFGDCGHEIDLVMSDVVLPDDTGLDLLEEFFAIKPSLRALLTSGYSEKGALVEMVTRRGIAFLHKPYTLVHLLDAVRNSIFGLKQASTIA